MTILELLEQKVAEQLRVESEYTLDGGPQDFSWYRYNIGKIDAFKWVQDAIKEIKDLEEE